MCLNSLERLLLAFENGASQSIAEARAGLGDAYASLTEAGLIVRAADAETIYCRECGEPHELETVELGGAPYFCGHLGSRRSPLDAIRRVAVAPGPFAEACFRAIVGDNRLTATEVAAGIAWEARVGREMLPRPLIVVRQLSEPENQPAWKGYLTLLGSRGAGRVYIAGEPPGGDIVGDTFVVERLSNLLRLSSGGLEALNRPDPGLITPPVVGVRGWSKRALELFRERVQAGVASPSLPEEARQIRALLLEERTAADPKVPGEKRLKDLLRTAHREAFPLSGDE